MSRSDVSVIRLAPPRLPVVNERWVHYFFYSTIGGLTALVRGAQFSAWEWAILALAVAGAVHLATWWAKGSRLLLIAGALAGASILSVGFSNGPVLQAIGRTLATSQAQILGMSVLVVTAFACFLASLWSRTERAYQLGEKLVAASVILGLSAMLVRWEESYRLGQHLGHIPISNLYEVFVLFVVIIGMIQMWVMNQLELRKAAGLMSLVAVAGVAFLTWYALERGAHEIQPLVPALDSYWMKLHVPANFIGYGAFCLAAMLGVARLLVEHKGRIRSLPSADALEEGMYRLIAAGFVFFTVATILGALWAAEAWGGYWSWDPKETWALIVWLNYASWLHMRLVHGFRGVVTAWWAVVGLLVTLFAFLGVNMYLSGLHSYGSL